MREETKDVMIVESSTIEESKAEQVGEELEGNAKQQELGPFSLDSINDQQYSYKV